MLFHREGVFFTPTPAPSVKGKEIEWVKAFSNRLIRQSLLTTVASGKTFTPSPLVGEGRGEGELCFLDQLSPGDHDHFAAHVNLYFAVCYFPCL